jgi:hypothetical protein
MRSTCLSIGLFALLSGSGWTQEPVLRVTDIKALQAGDPVLEHRQPDDKLWYHAFVGTTGAVRDHFKTDARTVASLEFFIGGRVGLNKDTEIEVVTERSVSDSQAKPQKIILHSGALWAKSGKLKQTLEIQTNGGVMGIKGTEFVLETSDGKTNLAVLEGAVEVSDEHRKPVGVAGPGDTYSLEQGGGWRTRHRDPEELRRELEESSIGQALAIIMEEIQLLKRDLQSARERLEQLQNALAGGAPTYHLAAPFGKAIQTGVAKGGLTGLSPAGVAEPLPVFRWNAHPGADGYIVFVAADPKFERLIYSVRTRDSQAVYPSTSRPLAKGTYHWRVLPVDGLDQPLHGATQAVFQVAAQS